MATVISNDRLQKHNVDKYNFKVLSIGGEQISHQEPRSKLIPSTDEPEKEPAPQNRRETDIDASAISQTSKDALIESLMQKTDEMSSNFIKLQMKLEAKEEEYKASLEKIKEESFNQGVEIGLAQAKEKIQKDKDESFKQFGESIIKLQESAKSFSVALEDIKSDLINAALDISKEVISKELSQNSAEIAKVLSDELIKDLQTSSKVTLRVNPKDHGPLSEYVGSLENVEIVSDSAVSEGGVIAISDAGNIDAQISKRFERVKRAALSE
jgi:flagellar assembly protein FliH